MRGLVGQLRRPVRAAAGVASGSRGPHSELETALRRVTHSDCAAVPSEAVYEAVRLASESEESLALVLRHVEENIAAPPREWRRVHGAVALLERLLRPGPAAGRCSESLVGRVWYEVKVQERLKVLATFDYPEDPRVALLLRRAAVAAQAEAEKQVLADSLGYEEEGSTAPDSRSDSARSGNSAPSDGPGAETIGAATTAAVVTASPLDLAAAGARSGGVPEAAAADHQEQTGGSRSRAQPPHLSLGGGLRRESSASSGSKRRTSSPGSPQVLGRPAPVDVGSREVDLEAAIKATNLRQSVSALDALNDVDTRWKERKVSEQALASTQPGEDRGVCCWCCRRRRAGETDAARRTPPPARTPELPSAGESDLLLL